MSRSSDKYLVRTSELKDIPSMIQLCQAVYPQTPPWTPDQLTSHQNVFPEGQLVIIDKSSQKLIGMAASLIIYWDDYDWFASWGDFTNKGLFTNHDPASGKTLYGAEIMVHPSAQGTGAGTLLYRSREELARKFNLLRIRAGARLRGYHRYASQMSPEDYVRAIVLGNIKDPTLSFQMKNGFQVLAAVSHYLRNDPESLGHAAIIEWLNLAIAKKSDIEAHKASSFYKEKT